jgi:hypothetical protein
LIDEDVPESVAQYLRERGHIIHYVRELSLAGSPDPIVAAAGDRLGAVIVTWNTRDFRKLASRVPQRRPGPLTKTRAAQLPMLGGARETARRNGY